MSGVKLSLKYYFGLFLTFSYRQLKGDFIENY